MQTSVQPLTHRDASCADASPVAIGTGQVPPVGAGPAWAPLFPPRDADAEARRRWLASAAWPEVVFASAGTV